MRTLYDILGVTPHATPAELKAAWRRAAMKWHPDRNRGREHYAQAQFQRINDAYVALTNPLCRAEYDLALHASVRRIAPQSHGKHRPAPLWRWSKWARLFLRNARMAPRARRAVRRVSRSHWMAGIGTAIAAAVLIADLSIDDAPLRSNFVSRQHGTYGSGTLVAPTHTHGSAGGRQDAYRAPGAPADENSAPAGHGRPSPNGSSTVGAAAAAPEADPALAEMHAALARLRALARTARDDTPPTGDTRHPRDDADTAAPIRSVRGGTAAPRTPPAGRQQQPTFFVNPPRRFARRAGPVRRGSQ
ncbi:MULTISPECIES: J domain-containing protein [Mycetohabitans]|uniref:J domain-containing protein n=1 Tax=Mycetohabitans TaxID=2571159 RepID=UPI001E3B3BD2|nr:MULTISPECIES: J domain-containing protein [Mycetohabitans]